ncbi:MAG: site-specific integrase, partial [Alistipes sp.]|nr:site-specific integrase [Alistipes sp.]
MKATISVICYKSKTLANGEHPLMLRITQNRKSSYKSLNVSILAKHWDFERE